LGRAVAEFEYGVRGDCVVVCPTAPVQKRLVDPTAELKAHNRDNFYVALTRGCPSLAIAMGWGAPPLPAGLSLYEHAAPV
jgi:hypothetical protein